MAKPASWSANQNEKSRTRSERRLGAERKKHREERADDLRARLSAGEIADVATAKAVMRSVVEGDVRTYSDDVRAIDAEQHSLRDHQVVVQGELAVLERPFQGAVDARDRHMRIQEALDNWGRRSKLPGSEGSRAAVVVFTALLVVLEGVLLKPVFEDLVRTLVPSLANVTGVSLAAIAVVVALGVVAVIAAAREAKRYVVDVHRAELAEAGGEDSARLARKPSPNLAYAIALVAIAVQALLFILRFLVDTGDGSGRSVFLLVSLIVGLLVAVVAYLEYRHEAGRPQPEDWDPAVIDGYLRRHREVGFHIPHRVNVLEAGKLDELVSALHGYQQLTAELGSPEIMTAINELIDGYKEEQRMLREPPPYSPPAVTATGSVADGGSDDDGSGQHADLTVVPSSGGTGVALAADAGA